MTDARISYRSSAAEEEEEEKEGAGPGQEGTEKHEGAGRMSGGLRGAAAEVGSRDEEEGLLAARPNPGAGDGEVVVLEHVNLVVPRGRLMIICGEVGAGKSTLLAAIAHAHPVAAGRVWVTGSRAYAGQTAFIMTGTVRENIVFQLPWEPLRYKDALARAQLLPDIAQLPLGDETVVGSEGVQLSGGQRARVALARVLYADAEVVLLDDIMAALDAHTGAMVWRDVVCWCKQRGKTVVLVTHQLQLLQRDEVCSSACLLLHTPHAQ